MLGLNPFSKKKPPLNKALIIARLNARVQPIDRGEYFEDPLDEALKSSKIGEVTGGGTQLADEPDGIEFCDVEIMAVDFSDETIAFVVETLEKLGAPKGSRLLLDGRDDEVPFGKLEGLGLFLNGTDLPKEVYEASDVNEIIAECERLMQDIGSFRGHWGGSEETALYFYGSTFAEMEAAISEYIATDPGCDLSRIVQIA